MVPPPPDRTPPDPGENQIDGTDATGDHTPDFSSSEEENKSEEEEEDESPPGQLIVAPLSPAAQRATEVARALSQSGAQAKKHKMQQEPRFPEWKKKRGRRGR